MKRLAEDSTNLVGLFLPPNSTSSISTQGYIEHQVQR